MRCQVIVTNKQTNESKGALLQVKGNLWRVCLHLYWNPEAPSIRWYSFPSGYTVLDNRQWDFVEDRLHGLNFSKELFQETILSVDVTATCVRQNSKVHFLLSHYQKMEIQRLIEEKHQLDIVRFHKNVTRRFSDFILKSQCEIFIFIYRKVHGFRGWVA